MDQAPGVILISAAIIGATALLFVYLARCIRRTRRRNSEGLYETIAKTDEQLAEAVWLLQQTSKQIEEKADRLEMLRTGGVRRR